MQPALILREFPSNFEQGFNSVKRVILNYELHLRMLMRFFFCLRQGGSSPKDMTEGRGDDPAAETPFGQGAEASSDRSSAVGFFLVFFSVCPNVD